MPQMSSLFWTYLMLGFWLSWIMFSLVLSFWMRISNYIFSFNFFFFFFFYYNLTEISFGAKKFLLDNLLVYKLNLK